MDKEFAHATKLDATDITFLFLATALQCIRQYVLSNEKFRLTAKQGDSLADSALSLAPPDWKDVLTQSVPYDAIKTGSHVTDTGLAGTTHRYRTLGHDPVFGWVFGTANIMTNSLTKMDFETYQVKSMQIIRHYPLGAWGMLDRAVSYSIDDPKLLAASVARQAIHFGSDYFTKQGLPVPLISTVNNSFAQTMLTKWHIDMYSITRGTALSVAINQLVACIHRLFYNEITDGNTDLYEVRTRKILSYSNTLASGSNIIYVALSGDLTKLDVGGLIVTLYRLLTDYKFIQQVKLEFMEKRWYDLITGDEFSF